MGLFKKLFKKIEKAKTSLKSNTSIKGIMRDLFNRFLTTFKSVKTKLPREELSKEDLDTMKVYEQYFLQNSKKLRAKNNLKEAKEYKETGEKMTRVLESIEDGDYAKAIHYLDFVIEELEDMIEKKLS